MSPGPKALVLYSVTMRTHYSYLAAIIIPYSLKKKPPLNQQQEPKSLYCAQEYPLSSKDNNAMGQCSGKTT